jgi:hypothetical protein
MTDTRPALPSLGENAVEVHRNNRPRLGSDMTHIPGSHKERKSVRGFPRYAGDEKNGRGSDKVVTFMTKVRCDSEIIIAAIARIGDWEKGEEDEGRLSP